MSQRPLPELAREITHGAVRLSAATAAWLMLVAEFDERGGWGGAGIKSCAHWLSWQCGLGLGTAREHVRVARALRHLPLTTAAFVEGRISYAKARALARVAEPATEFKLLDFALVATASQTERTLREIRRADQVDQRTVAERRQFDHWWEDDGMLVVRARLSPEEGADFLNAVQARAEREARRERAEAKRVAGERDLTAVDPDIARRYEEPVGRLAAQQSTARRCAALASLARDAAHVGRRAGDPPAPRGGDPRRHGGARRRRGRGQGPHRGRTGAVAVDRPPDALRGHRDHHARERPRATGRGSQAATGDAGPAAGAAASRRWLRAAGMS